MITFSIDILVFKFIFISMCHSVDAIFGEKIFALLRTALHFVRFERLGHLELASDKMKSDYNIKTANNKTLLKRHY